MRYTTNKFSLQRKSLELILGNILQYNTLVY